MQAFRNFAQVYFFFLDPTRDIARFIFLQFLLYPVYLRGEFCSFSKLPLPLGEKVCVFSLG
jgi:hypothetical protein